MGLGYPVNFQACFFFLCVHFSESCANVTEMRSRSAIMSRSSSIERRIFHLTSSSFKCWKGDRSEGNGLNCLLQYVFTGEFPVGHLVHLNCVDLSSAECHPRHLFSRTVGLLVHHWILMSSSSLAIVGHYIGKAIFVLCFQFIFCNCIGALCTDPCEFGFPGTFPFLSRQSVFLWTGADIFQIESGICKAPGPPVSHLEHSPPHCPVSCEKKLEPWVIP